MAESLHAICRWTFNPGKDGFVVTRNGKPAAALVYLDEDLLDDFIIAHHPALKKELQEAMKEYGEKGGVDLDTVIEELERRSRSSRKPAARGKWSPTEGWPVSPPRTSRLKPLEAPPAARGRPAPNDA